MDPNHPEPDEHTLNDLRTAFGVCRADGKADGEVTLTMDELEGLDEAGVKALYEQRVAAAAGRGTDKQEDFSDMVAAKAAQQKRKLAGKTQDGGGKGAKKSKADSFKF